MYPVRVNYSGLPVPNAPDRLGVLRTNVPTYHLPYLPIASCHLKYIDEMWFALDIPVGCIKYLTEDAILVLGQNYCTPQAPRHDAMILSTHK